MVIRFYISPRQGQFVNNRIKKKDLRMVQITLSRLKDFPKEESSLL